MSEFKDSFHQVTAFIISQLAAFLQLKYRADDPLFSTHPTTMLVATSSFMIYYVVHLMLLRSSMIPRFTAVAQLLLVWSAYVAVSALAAALFPAWASASVYVIFVLLSTGELLYMFAKNLIIEEDEDEDEDEEGETLKFRIYRRRVGRLCGSVAKFFGQQTHPTLPIRI